MGVRRKIAIIGCEPKDQIKFKYGYKKYDLRYFVRRRLKEFGKLIESKTYWPVEDKKDFPGSKYVDAIIISGSILDVNDKTLSEHEWMRKLLDFIADVHQKVPMLGICFGHQAIAKVFGSDVKRYNNDIFYEIGFEPTTLTQFGQADPLFNRFSKNFTAAYSHFCHIDRTPTGGIMLAESGNPNNHSIQAFRVNTLTYGVQFHPEFWKINIIELAKAREDIIKENMPDRKINVSDKNRQDQKILKNFIDMI